MLAYPPVFDQSPEEVDRPDGQLMVGRPPWFTVPPVQKYFCPSRPTNPENINLLFNYLTYDNSAIVWSYSTVQGQDSTTEHLYCSLPVLQVQ